MSKAFTLAEVLITLGIIGVVAAMTLPTLIQEQNNKALEAAFKKSYANLHNAFNSVIADGYPVFVLNPINGSGVDNDSEFARQVYSKYRQLKKLSNSETSKYDSSLRNYTKQATADIPRCSQSMNGTGSFITPDGSTLAIRQNCQALWFTIDTNGIYKGPNALGHDIFIFVAPKNTNKLIPAYRESELTYDENGNPSYNNTPETAEKCSPTSKSNINGATCATYAILDKCPGDNTKSYWKCLPK